MMERKRSETTKNFLAILALAIIIAAVGHIVSVISYNSREHVTRGADDSKQAVMALNERAERW